jgi:periplasmic copper chaperone A
VSGGKNMSLRVLLAAGAVVGALALAGCGAGQQAQTSQQVAAVGGASGTAGQVAIRNAEIAYPGTLADGPAHEAGGNAVVEMTIVNGAATADRIQSITSTVGPVQVIGDAALEPQLAVVSGNLGDPAALPGTKKITVEITGLTQDILSGRTYPLTFRFQNGGTTTVDVPVATSTTPREDQAPEAEGGH